jgi:hypothetical protein
MKSDLTHKLRALIAALTLCLLPTTAWSVQLFEGNLGYDGDWLHVLDSSAMSDRIYWYDLGTDVTYRFQLATDEAFFDVVLDVGGIATNYIEPDVGPGFYYFRVSAADVSGAVVSTSDTGTLEVIVDHAPPSARIVSPTAGEAFQKGDVVSIQLEVSDDTLLRLARFTIGGDYAGVLGLKTENYKLKPSFGEPRIVTFDYQVPTTGQSGTLEISVDVSDVMHNTVTTAVVLGDAGTTGTTSRKGRGRGKNK